ncbi:MAG: HEAT repeat domain-containing protein [Candidatus Hodarchaeales archaeon]
MPVNLKHTWEKMVQKVLHDPDKFERMFAARYLSKYQYFESKAILLKLLEDDDLDVVRCATRLLREKGEAI